MIPSTKILNSLTFKGFALLLPLTLASAIAPPTYPQANPPSKIAPPTYSQTNPANPANPPSKDGPGRTLTVRSDIQEADSKTGIMTARGNVQINYPARQIQATAIQAQYFSRERRIVLKGDVYVLQEGNSLRGETVTYMIDEGRFIALPESQGQVESIYIVSPTQDAEAQNTVNPETPPYNPKPAFKTPMSPPTTPQQ